MVETSGRVVIGKIIPFPRAAANHFALAFLKILGRGRGHISPTRVTGNNRSPVTAFSTKIALTGRFSAASWVNREAGSVRAMALTVSYRYRPVGLSVS